MELSYWESRWNKKNIGFHMPDGYPGLRNYWSDLNLTAKPTCLVPLCGKTVDMIFLGQKCKKVTGVEISQKAVESFFEENNFEYQIDRFADFQIYRSGNIHLWQGDFLKFPENAGSYDLIYDKAALVALPPDKRKAYAEKLNRIANDRTKLLLHHFIYPQSEMNGPPFSVSEQEIESYFEPGYAIDLLNENEIPSDHFVPFHRRGLRSHIMERLLLIETI